LDGSIRVFPIPSTIKGDNYCRIEIDGAVITDRSLYDIVNNSIVFRDAPVGTQVDVLVVQSEESIGSLGTTTSIDVLAAYTTELTNINAKLTDIHNVATKLSYVENVSNLATEIEDLYTVRADIQDIHNNLQEILDSDIVTQSNIWMTEALKMTANSYANEAEDVPVKIYTSNGDGTFSYVSTSNPAVYSALHWHTKAALVGSGYLKTEYNLSDLADVQTARDNLDVYSQGEMDLALDSKLGIDQLGTNLTLYFTTAGSDDPASGYGRIVTSVDDPFYNNDAQEVPTGVLLEASADDEDTPHTQLLASFETRAGILNGDAGILSVPTIGGIRRSNTVEDSGQANDYASFYFKMYKRDGNGVETFIGKSGNTPFVQMYARPVGGYQFETFNANCIFNDGYWTINDRIVIKFFANTALSNDSCAYYFKIGGEDPVRSLIPATLDVTYRRVFHALTYSTDGKEILYTRLDAGEPDATQYDHWRVEANVNYTLENNKLKEEHS
jgi:hypothetical protein